MTWWSQCIKSMCSLILGLAISFSISAVLEISSSCFSSSCLCSSVERQRETLGEAEKHQPSVSYRVFKVQVWLKQVKTLTMYHSKIIFQSRPFYFKNNFTVSGEIWTLSVQDTVTWVLETGEIILFYLYI